MAVVPSPVLQLTCDDLLWLQPSLQAYLDRFQPLFPRRLRRGVAVRGAA